MSVTERTDSYDIKQGKLFEVAMESWPEWYLNAKPLNSVQTI